MSTERFDFARFDQKPTLTPQGFLRIRANLTRVGVLQYQRADGTIARELRHPSEVFKRESLATLEGAPMTDMHTAMVNPGNVRRLQVGTVGESLRTDSKYVKGHVTVQDAIVIGMVQEGKRHELSPGYDVDLDETPGTWGGEHYDAVQRNIIYNHVAIGPRGWGRSGDDVSLRMDGGMRVDHTELSLFLRDRISLLALSLDGAAQQSGIDRFRLDGFLDGFGIPTEDELQRLAALVKEPVAKLLAMVPLQDRGELPIDRRDGLPPQNSGDETMKVSVRIDGVEYPCELPDALAPNFQAAVVKLRTTLETTTNESTERQGRVDALEAELKTAKADLEKATDPKALDEAVTRVVQLRLDAAKVLPADTDLAGKTAREIKEMVILERDKDARLDGKDDSYIDGMFAGFVAAASVTPPVKGTAAARAATPTSQPVTRTDGEPDPHDADAARERMVARNRDLWKQEAPKSN